LLRPELAACQQPGLGWLVIGLVGGDGVGANYFS